MDVEEHLGEPLPLEARFTDETGREVRLGEVLPKDKPDPADAGVLRVPHAL